MGLDGLGDELKVVRVDESPELSGSGLVLAASDGLNTEVGNQIDGGSVDEKGGNGGVTVGGAKVLNQKVGQLADLGLGAASVTSAAAVVVGLAALGLGRGGLGGESEAEEDKNEGDDLEHYCCEVGPGHWRRTFVCTDFPF